MRRGKAPDDRPRQAKPVLATEAWRLVSAQPKRGRHASPHGIAGRGWDQGQHACLDLPVG